MNILRALEGLRTPFFDRFFSAVTYLGDQTVFIAVVLIMLWCVDKRKGYCLFFIGMVGTAANQLLKAIFLVPRPWVKDPSFTIVEEARAAATGYSFPSGHTQSATGIFSAFALWGKRRWAVVLCAAVILITAFSRMYLGVHTPLDVGVSLAVGLATAYFGVWAFGHWSNKTLRGVAFAFVACLTAYLLLMPKGAANVAEFDAHGLKSAYTLLGAAGGLCFAWWADENYLHYDIRALPWAQLLKLTVGLLLLLAVKALLKAPLNALLRGNPAADCLRYCLVSLFGGLVWPLTFPFWARLGQKTEKPKGDE